MDPQDFASSSAGICRKTPAGVWTFVPNPLPPKLEVDWKLTGLISEADQAMAELSGTGRLLPNPHLLIRPYLRREAIYSSRIENTITDMQQLVMFEVDSASKPEPPDVREVANYVRALEVGLGRLSQLPISSRLICELHEVLMKTVRGGDMSKTPGEFRRSQNWIGPAGATLTDATYVPPPPDEMQNALSQWEKYLNTDTGEPVLVKCAWLHYQFEAIHPFLDGNGRIGRLLITLFLCSQGRLSQPLLYLSGFFDETREDYYRLLLGVSQKGQWREWLEYFLRGVRVQSQAALGDTQEILKLYASYREKLKMGNRIPKTAPMILDEVFGLPVLSIQRFSAKTKESFPNVSKGVEFWIKHGLLEEVTRQKRNRLFVAHKLLEMTSGSGKKKIEPLLNPKEAPHE